MQKKLVSVMVMLMFFIGFSMLTLAVQLTRASTLAADFNGDGKVDVKDIALLGKSFGTYAGHPRWNATYDLNHDGKVDALDAIIVLKSFGKTVS